MAITTLDPKTALIVIDLQKGSGPAHRAPNRCSRENSRRWPMPSARTACRSCWSTSTAAPRAAPSRRVATATFPADWAELMAELNQQPQDHLVTKRTWGAFTDTELEAYLKEPRRHPGGDCRRRHQHRRGVDRAPGVRAGFNVTLAVDAMTDLNAEAHAQHAHAHFPAARRERHRAGDRRHARADPRMTGLASEAAPAGSEPGPGPAPGPAQGLRSEPAFEPASEESPVKGTFRSLRGFNYRVWACGALVSNVGTWMQRMAQDWLVLTELTHNNATAVGVVMALQFGPHAAAAALDRLRGRPPRPAQAPVRDPGGNGRARPRARPPHRSPGSSQLWHVYVFAFLLGCVTAFDSPARQTFVAELVGEADLANAVALNSTSFNAAPHDRPGHRRRADRLRRLRLGVPDQRGVVRRRAVFAGAAARPTNCTAAPGASARRGSFVDGFRYVWKRPDLKAILLMLFLIGDLRAQLPDLHLDHVGHGVSRRRGPVRLADLDHGDRIGDRRASGRPAREAAAVRCSWSAPRCSASAARWPRCMPNYRAVRLSRWSSSASRRRPSRPRPTACVQLSTEPAMRGRVMAILLAIALGGTPLGAPIVGWVADQVRPALGARRWRRLRFRRRAGRASLPQKVPQLAGVVRRRADSCERGWRRSRECQFVTRSS